MGFLSVVYLEGVKVSVQPQRSIDACEIPSTAHKHIFFSWYEGILRDAFKKLSERGKKVRGTLLLNLL